MEANTQDSKSTPNHVIFKKISRDKSVSSTEVRGLVVIFFFFLKELFRIDIINIKIL